MSTKITKSKTYECINCKYSTKKLSEWNRHCTFKKHLAGGRQTKFECDECDHEGSNAWNLKVHKINNHSTKEERAQQKHYCADCDMVFFGPLEKIKHMEKKKHKVNVEKLKAKSDIDSDSESDSGSDIGSSSESGED